MASTIPTHLKSWQGKSYLELTAKERVFLFAELRRFLERYAELRVETPQELLALETFALLEYQAAKSEVLG